jgi:hypothetical protein
MATLTLSDEQVIELVKQLQPEKQAKLLSYLLSESWGKWIELSQYGQERVRHLAKQKGKNWDRMNEEERDALIDEVLHED